MLNPSTIEQLGPAIFAAFRVFIGQRPGLDPRNYFSDWRDKEGRKAYNSEARRIQNDGKRARQALALASAYPFDAQAMIDATSAYSGRLQLEVKGDSVAIDYTTGQYWPTEYRIAAAVVLERYAEAVRPKTVSGRIPRTIGELKEVSREAGGHFFDRGSMKFFRSRVLPNLYVGPGGVYFVTSEQYSDTSRRAYTVRVFNPQDASVNTFGEFNELDRAEALALARHAAKSDPAICQTCAGSKVAHGRPCYSCQK